MDNAVVPIKVFCRIRPLNAAEVCSEFLPVIYDDRISLSLSGKGYTYDAVFGPDSTQQEVYNCGVADIVNDVLKGYNGTIFAYGQTSSGKTHTMEGELSSPVLKGVTPRIVEDVLQHIDKLSAQVQVEMKVSYFEIYMDKVKDLLDVTKVNLPVHEDKNKVPYVKGVTAREVKTLKDIYKVIEEGKSNRSVAITNMNEHSSRSHSVFLLEIKQSDEKAEKTIVGKLYLVDLAGSEKVHKSGAEGVTLNEAKKINKSLSALGNVISALADGNKNHVPYRDSKLTRILQESLGGNSRTSIFICCSPSHLNEAETRSTLMFGQRAKTIRNQIKINEELTADEWKRRYEKEKEKNAQLRKKLAQIELGAAPLLQVPAPVTAVNQTSTVTLDSGILEDIEMGSSEAIIMNPPALSPRAAAATATIAAVANGQQPLTSYASLPCLLPHSIEVSAICEECLKYQQDIAKLHQQLDDRDDELDERSREILSLESKLREQIQEEQITKQNNTLLITEYKDLEGKYIEAQEEVKTVLAALEELASSYQDKDTKTYSQVRNIEELTARNNQLQEDLTKSQTELEEMKVRYDRHKKQTLNMFLDIFNDLEHRTSSRSSRLNSALERTGLYGSVPNLDILSSSYSSSLASSDSAGSSLGTFGSKHDIMSESFSGAYTHGSPYNSELPSPDHTRMTASVPAPTTYNSSGFQDKVTELKTRLQDVLEKDFNVLPDTSSYTRNIKLKRGRAKTGRVFTVLSRARGGTGAINDTFTPVPIGRRLY